MKSYTQLHFTVNVPTPNELQSESSFGDAKIVISHFRDGQYAVARFERETDQKLIDIGFDFKSVADQKDVFSFFGKTARSDVIRKAFALLEEFN
jgi:hypothetical protein